MDVKTLEERTTEILADFEGGRIDEAAARAALEGIGNDPAHVGEMLAIAAGDPEIDE